MQDLYTKEGKQWKGNTHKMPNGTVHTNKEHSKTAQRLYSLKDVPSKPKNKGK